MMSFNVLPSVQHLSTLLANTYVLLVKTQHFHWNVKGPHFHSLHALFESQYLELFEAIDAIAERIRMLDKPVTASLKAFHEQSALSEAEGSYNSQEMLAALQRDHQALIESIHESLKAIDENDQGNQDFFTQRLMAHEKAAWMLHSSLDQA